MPGKHLFSELWLENSSYKLWLERDMDKLEAKCKGCIKAFDVLNTGKSALKSHVKGKKHIYLKETQHLLEVTSPLKTLKLKPTEKEQQLHYTKVDVGFIACTTDAESKV